MFQNLPHCTVEALAEHLVLTYPEILTVLNTSQQRLENRLTRKAHFTPATVPYEKPIASVHTLTSSPRNV